MKHLAFFLYALAASAGVWAQSKQLTPKDIVARTAYPKSLMELSWRGGSNSFAYLSFEDGGLMGAKVGEKPAQIASFQVLQAAMPTGVAPLQYLSPQWLSETGFYFEHDNAVWGYDISTQKTAIRYAVTAPDAEDVDICSALHVAFTRKGNLYVCPRDSDKPIQITKEDGYNIVAGKAAHRQEFGITKGTFWSPKGNKLAFYRMDQTMVRDYPLVSHTDSATEKPLKYPMAGTPSHHVTVGVYDIKSKKTIYLKTGEPKEQYLTNITWSPDEQFVYIAVVNRDQNHVWLNRYNAKTGDFDKTLFEETHDKYVEPEHGLTFVPGNDKQFIWFSERDGFQHLYLFDTDGSLLHRLTQGSFEVTELLGFDEKHLGVFYVSTEKSPIERHVSYVALDGMGKRTLTTAAGTHNAVLAPNGRFLFDNYSSLTTPNTVSVINAESGETTQTILEAANPLKDYKLGTTELLTIKSADGVTDLHCRLVKPVDFDPTKKYPVMVYVYGGPHAQLVENNWLAGGDLFVQYMATKGYVCFTVDSRGSAHRGLAFEQATFRQLGTAEMDDQMKGVEFLKAQPYVDADRMGVFGWSFGGFMTTSLMTRKAGTFKVGVAGGPVIDWKYYEIMYTERYMDTPQQNPEGYAKAALPQYAPALKGKLLMIHGLLDDTVVPLHSNAFVNAAINKGIQLDYFPYPLHPHNVRGRDRAHLYDKVAQYFDANL